MEHADFLTYKCNLRCEYCFAKDIVFDDAGNTIADEQVNMIIDYFRDKPKVSVQDTVTFISTTNAIA